MNTQGYDSDELDDLYELQKSFINGSARPAAKVVRRSKPPASTPPPPPPPPAAAESNSDDDAPPLESGPVPPPAPAPKKVSKFMQQKQKDSSGAASSSSACLSTALSTTPPPSAPSSILNLSIVERSVSEAVSSKMNASLPATSSSSKPAAPTCASPSPSFSSMGTFEGGGFPSLNVSFGSLAMSKGKKKVPVPSSSSSSSSSIPPPSSHPGSSSNSSSNIDAGIHESNLRHLSSMSKEEIMDSQRELSSVLSPEALAFLKNRKSAKGKSSNKEADTTSSGQLPSNASSSSSSSKASTFKPPPQPHPLPFPQTSEALALAVASLPYSERLKLEWTLDRPVPKSKAPTDVVRLDLDGNVLRPPSAARTDAAAATSAAGDGNGGGGDDDDDDDDDAYYQRELYHHEDPLPGYNLEHISTLLRSTDVRQQLIAARAVARYLRSPAFQSPPPKNAGDDSRGGDDGVPPLLPLALRAALDCATAGGGRDKRGGPLALYVVEALEAIVQKREGPLPPPSSSSSSSPHADRTVALKPAEDVGGLGAYRLEASQQSDADLFRTDPVWCLMAPMKIIPAATRVVRCANFIVEAAEGLCAILQRVARRSPGAASAIDKAVPFELYLDDTHGSPKHRQHLTYYFAEQIRKELA